jgi:hypothetical protein
MGTWGVKLYEDDLACEIKEDYINLLREGIDNEEATKRIIESYQSSIGDTDEGSIFWFVLADLQWKHGRLLPEVKEEALFHLESSRGLDRWELDAKQLEKRNKLLDALNQKLLSPQPEEKKIRPLPKGYKCEWNIGDVLAYQLESQEAKDIGIDGRYLIFIKIDEAESYPNNIIPIVRIKITKEETLPKTVEEINALEYFQVGSELKGDYHYDEGKEQFVWKSDGSDPVPKYVFKLRNTSKRAIPKKLIYIGNFKDEITLPDVEYIPSDDICIQGYIWKRFDKNIIDIYKNYMLEESELDK